MRSRPPRSDRPPPRPWRERVSGTPRLALAVVLLLAGTLVAVTARTPPATGPVVVAVRAVPAGAVLAAADLAVARRALADRPDAALTDPGPAVGHRVVATLARGQVLTGGALAPQGLTAAVGSGRAVATVTVAAARAGVVTVGDVLRLVVADRSAGGLDVDPADASATPVTVADAARVLAVWPAPEGDDVATLVVDVDVGSASRLAVIPVDVLVGFVIVTA